VVGDALLPESKIARITAETPAGAPVVLATKAQHNAVSHNHNDVGVFVLHVDGETLICDPERGLYDQYVFWGKDKVVFSNSYGHSVPVIANRLQSEGEAYAGEIVAYDVGGETKEVAMRIEGAYKGVWGLDKALRSLKLTPDGELVLEDQIRLSRVALPVEEAIVTWLDTTVDGDRAVITGEKHDLVLTIEAPEDAVFALEVLEEESKANNKERILKRLSFTGKPVDKDLTMRLRARVMPKS
jgi:predicted RNA-binding protein